MFPLALHTVQKLKIHYCLIFSEGNAIMSATVRDSYFYCLGGILAPLCMKRCVCNFCLKL